MIGRELLALGFHVLPIHRVANGRCSCDRDDCPSPGKHPRNGNGVDGATNDPGIVDNWERKWPDANWGIASGKPLPGGGYLYIADIDRRNYGDETLAELGHLPGTRTSVTGNGMHYYFRTDTPLGIGKQYEGIDLLGAGAYVVAPGSVHPTGHLYAWDAGQPEEIAPAPPWARPAPRSDEPAPSIGPQLPGAVGRCAAYVAKIPGAVSGHRGHDQTFYVAQVITRKFALDGEDAWRVMTGYNLRCTPPWKDHQLRHKLLSAQTRGRMATEVPPIRLDEEPEPLPPPEAETSALPFLTPDTILDRVLRFGPLRHEPCGVPLLDEMTGGGPVFGTRWVVNGAPDAGKTALLVHMAHSFAAAGILVGYLAVDEDPEDVLTRFGQRQGFLREHFEEREPDVLASAREQLSPLPLLFFEGDKTLETCAEITARYAKERGMRGAALLVDSLQTVTCNRVRELENVGRQVSNYDLVTSNVRALRAVATKHRLICISTSEMNRGSYAYGDEKSRTGMAASSGSGAVEYQARVLISLTSVQEGGGLVRMRVDKNKHGPSGEEGYFRVDRRHMQLLWEEAPEALTLTDEERSAKRGHAAILQAADAIRSALLGETGLSQSTLFAKVKLRLGKCSKPTFDAALVSLESDVEVTPGIGKSLLYRMRVFYDQND